MYKLRHASNAHSFMVQVTAAQLKTIMPSAPDAPTWATALSRSANQFSINSPLRLAAFLAQIAHESGELRHLVENLNYSAAALRSTWPQRFRTDKLARAYARQPERIANFVYANRLG